MKTYTTWGRVRGDCGHQHATIEQAFACAVRDGLACRRAGGYSDRVVRVLHSRDDLAHYDVTRGPGELWRMQAALEGTDTPC